jgi:nucleoside-diphosphate-sugar epimerase
LTDRLLGEGHALRMLDNFATGMSENMAAVGGDAELVEGDIRSYERTHAATQGVDCVIQ